MHEVTWFGAALLGVAVATLLALLPPVWPALAIGAGGLAVATALFVAGYGRRRYAGAGTAYALGLLPAFVGAGASGALAGEYAGPTALVLATLGVASAVLVGARIAAVAVLRRLFRRLVRRTRRARIAALRSLAKLLGLLRTAVGLLGRYTRIGLLLLVGVGLVALAGLGSLLLNGLGVQRPIPWLGGEVDAVLALFVASLLVGFHALDAAQSTLIATREGVAAGQSAGSRVVAAVRRAREDRNAEE